MKIITKNIRSILLGFCIMLGVTFGAVFPSSANNAVACGTCDWEQGINFCNFNFPGNCGGNNGGPCGGVPCEIETE